MGSATSKYVYVGWHMVGEHDGSAWLWQEVPMPGEEMLEHMALDTNDLDGDSNTTEIRQYGVHTDFQATVWSLTDTSGNIVERYRYREPYGDTYTQNAAGTNIGDFASNVYHNKRLHGGVTDKASKLYDFRNRWLQAGIGAWISRDQLGVASSENVYQSFSATPLIRVDYWGLYDCQKGWVTIGSSADPSIVVCARPGDRDAYIGDCEGGDGCTELSWKTTTSASVNRSSGGLLADPRRRRIFGDRMCSVDCT